MMRLRRHYVNSTNAAMAPIPTAKPTTPPTCDPVRPLDGLRGLYRLEREPECM